ncbi:MAG TPA: SCO family protein [Thermoanaerobaculia bacterium]|nr:SCO family protein [Thermoanaerobaculia bacterium]
MKLSLSFLALALLAAPAGAQEFLSGTGPAGFAKVEQRLNVQLPLDLTFRDETGKVVKLGDYFGDKPVIITPVYYSCPMLCSVVLDGLVNTLHEIRFKMGEEYEVVTFSFDPRDTPEIAAGKKSIYTRRYGRPGSADGWHFLTGSETSVRELTEALGFRFTWDPKTGEFAHAAMVVIATPEGRISRYHWGINYDPRDVRLGLVEASQNTIGGATEQLLLLCYEYDPSTGKYSAVAMNIVRLGGAATVLALGGFIIVLTRRDRVKAQIKRDS